MERVNFTYYFEDEEGQEQMVSSSQKEKNGLYAREVCELFLNFMCAAGFSEQNVLDYFRK